MDISVFTPWFALVLSGAGAVLAFYLALRNKGIVAGVLATFSVLMILIGNLASIDTIKGLGIEAKTRSNLEESIAIKNDISEIAEAFSIASYRASANNLFNLPRDYEYIIKQIAGIEKVARKIKTSSRDLASERNNFNAMLNLKTCDPFQGMVRAILSRNGVEAEKINKAISAIEDYCGYYKTEVDVSLRALPIDLSFLDEKDRSEVKKIADKLASDIKSSVDNLKPDQNIADLFSGYQERERSAYRYYAGVEMPSGRN